MILGEMAALIWHSLHHCRHMPVILRQNGFSFFIYSNEHPPPHTHVRKGGGEAVFELSPEIQLRESMGMKVSDLRQAEELVKMHESRILESWNEHVDRQS